MDIKPIKSDSDCRATLKEIDSLMSDEPNVPKAHGISVFCGSGFQLRSDMFDTDRGKMPLPQQNCSYPETEN